MITRANNMCLFASSAERGAGVAAASLVIGAGLTGQSIARWLQRRDETAVFVDTRADADMSGILDALPSAQIYVGATEALDYSRFDRVIVSPGVAESEALLVRARERGLPVISDIEVFCRHAHAPIIAVTGSNGKSTVVSLLEKMCVDAGLSVRAGANLGTPALDLLDDEAVDYYLLELSSFQLQRTNSLDAAAACVLNISADHLDWHGSEQAYAQAKQRVYAQCDYAVVNIDDEAAAIGVRDNSIRIGFTLSPPAHGQFGLRMDGTQQVLAYGEQALLSVDELALQGRHNVANVLAALALGSAIDLPLSSMLKTARAFAGLAHRMQKVADQDGVLWINDSKATNAGAAIAAVNGLERPVILLAGGRAKGEDPQAFVSALPAHVKCVVVYGENAPELVAALAATTIAHERAADLVAAVSIAKQHASAGDAVLLAPAAASQDSFTNFAERGDVFARAVVEVLA